MKDVDFTPEWYAKSLVERKGSRNRVAGLALLAVLVLAWSCQSTSRTCAAALALERLQHSYEAQRGMIAQLDALAESHAQHAEDARLLADVSGGLTVDNLLVELSHLMPRALSMRAIYLQRSPRIGFPPPEGEEAEAEEQEPPATTLEITGWAASGTEIGSLVSRLAASELFDDVTLRYERPETVYDRRVVEFLVECRVPEFE